MQVSSSNCSWVVEKHINLCVSIMGLWIIIKVLYYTPLWFLQVKIKAVVQNGELMYDGFSLISSGITCLADPAKTTLLHLFVFQLPLRRKYNISSYCHWTYIMSQWDWSEAESVISGRPYLDGHWWQTRTLILMLRPVVSFLTLTVLCLLLAIILHIRVW